MPEVTREEFNRAMEGIRDRLDRIDSDLYNHGREGIKTQLTVFIAKQSATEEYRTRQVKGLRWWIMAAIALLGIVLGFLTYFATRKPTTSQVISQQTSEVAAESPQQEAIK